MKRKGKNLKPIKHNNIHSIPLHIYDPLSQAMSSSSIPPSAVSPYQMNPAIPNYMINPLAIYWQLLALQTPGLIQTPLGSQYTLEQLNDAALVIQKHVRGYLVRKKFVSWTFNPITRVRKPLVYQTESIIYETIQDLIIDCAVELCQDHYHPVCFRFNL